MRPPAGSVLSDGRHTYITRPPEYDAYAGLFAAMKVKPSPREPVHLRLADMGRRIVIEATRG